MNKSDFLVNVFIFSYIDHHEDYWFLNDNNPFYDNVHDENGDSTIVEEDEDLDIPEHRSHNFLDKCLKHKKINDKYASFISMTKNIEEIKSIYEYVRVKTNDLCV